MVRENMLTFLCERNEPPLSRHKKSTTSEACLALVLNMTSFTDSDVESNYDARRSSWLVHPSPGCPCFNLYDYIINKI